MATNNKLILAGKISAAHGIKGHLIIHSYTSPISNILDLELINGNNLPVKIRKIGIKSKEKIICSINNIDNRTEAEQLIGLKLYCLKDKLPKTKENEFYFEKLKDLKVLNTDKKEIGIVSHIFNFGAGDVIEIKFHDTKKQYIYPFTKEIFPEITDDYIIITEKTISLIN